MPSSNPFPKIWYLYLVLCADQTLYCGITTDLERRLAQHNNGTGAKYTRGRGPVELYYSQECPDHSSALKLEAQIKKLSRAEKLQLKEKHEPT